MTGEQTTGCEPNGDRAGEPSINMTGETEHGRFYVIRSHTTVVRHEIIEFPSLEQAAACTLAINELEEVPARVVRLGAGSIPGAASWVDAEGYLVASGLLPEVE